MRRAVAAIAFFFLLAVPSAGAWTWPVTGPVLTPFTFDPAHPYAGGQHRGIDIGAPPGADVVAPVAGTVTFAGTVPSSGTSLSILTADALSVTLTHLGSLAVAKGASVVEGATVGTVGPSGTPELTVPYVHLGVRTDANDNGYLDPLSFLPALAPAPVVPAPAPAPAPVAPPAAEAPTPPAVDPAAPSAAPAPVPVAEPEPEPAPAPAPAAPPIALVEPQPTPVPASAPDALTPAGGLPAETPAAAPRTAVPPAEPGTLWPYPTAPSARLVAATPAPRPVPAPAPAAVPRPAPVAATASVRRELPLHERRPPSAASPHHGIPVLLAALAAGALAVLLTLVRMIKGPSAASEGAAPVREDPRRAGVAVWQRPAPHRPRGGLRRAGGRVRALPPAQGRRRPDGERHGRARHAGDGGGGPERRVAA